jgi:hypothetical protein
MRFSCAASISQFIAPLFNGMSMKPVILFLKHVLVVAYCYFNFHELFVFSKHLHILLAFPNTYFADLNPQGQFDNLEAVKKLK